MTTMAIPGHEPTGLVSQVSAQGSADTSEPAEGFDDGLVHSHNWAMSA